MKRLDNVLVNSGYGSRKDVQKSIKSKHVRVNGKTADKPSMHVNVEQDEIYVFEEKLEYTEFVYLMLNKPEGFISATHDKRDRVVLDLIEDKDKFLDPYPIGRLDKDTVGLLIISNDGDMAHRVLSPKYHVNKKYFVRVDIKLEDSYKELFLKGITLEDNYKCKPAILNIINACDEYSECEITISEGKYHQIKRMFEMFKANVTYLKRVSFADIKLDENLKQGEYRHLTENEINILKSI